MISHDVGGGKGTQISSQKDKEQSVYVHVYTCTCTMYMYKWDLHVYIYVHVYSSLCYNLTKIPCLLILYMSCVMLYTNTTKLAHSCLTDVYMYMAFLHNQYDRLGHSRSPTMFNNLTILICMHYCIYIQDCIPM